MSKFTVRTREGAHGAEFGFDTLEHAESFIVSTLGTLVRLYDEVTITEEVTVRGTEHVRALVDAAYGPRPEPEWVRRSRLGTQSPKDLTNA